MGMLVNPYRHVAAGGGVDTLADLFASGEVGGFWIGDGPNTDGNVAGDSVTTATDTIFGHVMTLSANIAQPKLEASGSNVGTRFNGGTGSGQRLIYNFGSDIPQPYAIAVCITTGDTGSTIIATGSSSTKRGQISLDSSSNLIGFDGATLDSTINAPLGTRMLYHEANGASSKWFVDDSTTAKATGNAGTQVTNQLTIGALWDGTFDCNGLYFAWLIISRIPNATERARIMTRLGACGGLTI